MKEDDWFKVLIGLWSIVDFIFGVIVGLLLSRTQQKPQNKATVKAVIMIRT